MEKVINVTIGKIVFYIEEDGYKKLSEYLDSLNRHFSKDKDREEIIEDIEVSIAEKFVTLRKTKDRAIHLNDVEGVINQMGTLKDFKNIPEEDAEENSDENAEEASSEPIFQHKKKLYRNPDDVIIAGVASGIAAHFGMDTVYMRLIFFISIFFGGAGIIIYIVLWIVMPVAETTAQKLEMRGEKVTLKEIEKSVKNGIERLKKKDKIFGKIPEVINKIFEALGSVIKAIAKILRVIVGAALTVAGIAGLCFLSFGLTWLISGSGIPYTDVALNEFVNLSGAFYWAFIFAIYFLILLPLILLSILGVSLLKKRNVVSGTTMIALLVVWFSALGITLSVVFQNLPLIEEKIQEVHTKLETHSNLQQLK